MDYNGRKLVPYIPPAEYDKVAYEFLEQFYPDALKNPMPVPIEEIARTGLGLDVRYVCLSEELDIYGMTIFTDGAVEVYDLDERLYDTRIFKAKTVLIDPEQLRRRILVVKTTLLRMSVFIGTSIVIIIKCRSCPSRDTLIIVSVMLTSCQNLRTKKTSWNRKPSGLHQGF